jgi:hypothetical protein
MVVIEDVEPPYDGVVGPSSRFPVHDLNLQGDDKRSLEAKRAQGILSPIRQLSFTVPPAGRLCSVGRYAKPARENPRTPVRSTCKEIADSTCCERG